MFEFTIKSTKSIKEFSVVFDDGTAVMNTPSTHTDDVKSGKKRSKPAKKAKKAKKVKKTKNIEADKSIKKDNFAKKDVLLDFDDIKYTESTINKTIIQKPVVPDVQEINVAPELHNLDI